MSIVWHLEHDPSLVLKHLGARDRVDPVLEVRRANSVTKSVEGVVPKVQVRSLGEKEKVKIDSKRHLSHTHRIRRVDEVDPGLSEAVRELIGVELCWRERNSRLVTEGPDRGRAFDSVEKTPCRHTFVIRVYRKKPAWQGEAVGRIVGVEKTCGDPR